MIQPSPTLGRQASPGDPAQTGTPEPQTEKGPKQADSPKSRKPYAVTATNYRREEIAKFHAINLRALISVKKTFDIREAELQILLALMPYVVSAPIGIINIYAFIDNWYVSNSRARVIGAFHGLANKGFIQIFDQRSNGSRFVGITSLGERLLTVYYNKVDELIKTVVLRRSKIACSDNVRFQRIDPANVGTLYIKGMTTKYRHLYDRSKYFNADGSIKN